MQPDDGTSTACKEATVDTSNLSSASTDDALRYVLANVDDARAALETANSALATATAYGRIAVARNHDDSGGDEAR